MEKIPSLKCIIGGLEHSGTTMTAELLRQSPTVNGAFETGFLCVDHPSMFLLDKRMESFKRLVMNGYRISYADLQWVTQATGFSEMYDRLIERSFLDGPIYDKAPRYMWHLKKILDRFEVKALICVRDPRACWHSACRWKTTTMRSYIKHYVRYSDGYHQALSHHQDKIHLVQYEKLCTDPIEETKKIYGFLEIDFDPSFVELNNIYEVHADKVRSGGINPKVMDEYKQFMSISDQTMMKAFISGQIPNDWIWF